MDQYEEIMHRTWVQLLVDHGYKEEAAIALDIEVCLNVAEYEDFGEYHSVLQGVNLDVPTSMYGMVKSDEKLREKLERGLRATCTGRFEWPFSGPEELPIEYRVKSVLVEEGWREVVRKLIADRDSPNQGLVTRKLFARQDKSPYTYNEMRFASKSEIRIAQELEARGVLFFPLALAVRAETGILYKDHREVDFLVCEDGTWGILEVSYHPNRFEKDAEKDAWWKKSGILCVEHYTAERCYNRPSEVIDEFLEILAKYKK
jgi:hypothetical protein